MSNKKLSSALKTQKRKTQAVVPEIYGSLGIPLAGQRVVEVPGRNSYVFVRLRDNNNEVIQAFNNSVASSYDLPVIVVREGNRYTIAKVNSERYQNNLNNSAPFLPSHGTSHSFADGNGGDVTWVFSRQMMPGLVYPNPSTGTNVLIGSFPLYTTENIWTWAGETGTPDLLGYRPTTGSSSLMVLIYADARNGNPGVLVGSGSYFPYSDTGSKNIAPYIPAYSPSTQIPLAAVRLSTGTVSIGWDNLYDTRQWLHALPSGTASQGSGGLDTIGVVGQNKGVYQATGTIFNVNGSRLVLSASGTVLNLINSPDPQDNIGIYALSSGTPLATGTTINFVYPLFASVSGATIHAQSAGITVAETNSNDVFRVNSASDSDFVATINGAPAGSTVTYNAPSSGAENVINVASASQLAKIRLYNTTRGTSALISSVNTATNVITLTEAVPAGWANGDTITCRSQTNTDVSGASYFMDLEITSGPTNAAGLILFFGFTDAAGEILSIHPFEAFGAGKNQYTVLQGTQQLTGTVMIKLTTNVFCIRWSASGAANATVILRLVARNG